VKWYFGTVYHFFFGRREVPNCLVISPNSSETFVVNIYRKLMTSIGMKWVEFIESMYKLLRVTKRFFSFSSVSKILPLRKNIMFSTLQNCLFICKFCVIWTSMLENLCLIKKNKNK